MIAIREVSTINFTANELIAANLRAGITVQFTIPTQSMLPTLAPGDRVVARALLEGEPRIGDILLIRSEPYWLAHRMIDRRVVDSKVCIVTQGDYGTEPDGLWSSEQICGKIVVIDRAGTRQSFDSARAKWSGVLIAYLLSRRSDIAPARSGMWNTAALKVNAALVRGIVWLDFLFK